MKKFNIKIKKKKKTGQLLVREVLKENILLIQGILLLLLLIDVV